MTPPYPVPADVAAQVHGTCRPGELDGIDALLTVDADGVPDVCLLSRTELDCTTDRIRAVVASSKARRNLARSARATLWVWTPTPVYLALAVVRSEDGDGVTGYEFSITRVLRDELGAETDGEPGTEPSGEPRIALVPPRFRVADWLAQAERWDLSAAMLARLSAG
jgi:hypothetical protein